jgi:hypothetical protein
MPLSTFALNNPLCNLTIPVPFASLWKYSLISILLLWAIRRTVLFLNSTSAFALLFVLTISFRKTSPFTLTGFPGRAPPLRTSTFPSTCVNLPTESAANAKDAMIRKESKEIKNAKTTRFFFKDAGFNDILFPPANIRVYAIVS